MDWPKLRPAVSLQETNRAAKELGGAFNLHTSKASGERQGIKELDAALLRLFPRISDDARRALRRPLAQWRNAALAFLGSYQDRRADLKFGLVWLQIATSGPAHREFERGVLLERLLKEIDAAVRNYPVTCPYRWSCALDFVLKKVFGADDGAV